MMTYFISVLHYMNSSTETTIIVCSIIDILLGIAKALNEKNLNSTISSSGVIKHVTMIIIPALAYPLLGQINAGNVYMGMFTGLIILTMVLSSVENWVSLGLPFPAAVSKYIDDQKLSLDGKMKNNEEK